MICIDAYMHRLTNLLKSEFGDELVYVGLQGSYLRGEATLNSDADVMVVLKRLDRAVMDRYRAVIAQMDGEVDPCGFICSASDLKVWNPQECCQLLHSTKDVYGQLFPLLPDWTRENARDYVKRSLNDLYHELCHRYIYRGREHSARKLPQMEKNVFFILQNLTYLEKGVFYMSRDSLQCALTQNDRDVFAHMRRIGEEDFAFEEIFDILLKWCQDAMARVG